MPEVPSLIMCSLLISRGRFCVSASASVSPGLTARLPLRASRHSRLRLVISPSRSKDSRETSSTDVTASRPSPAVLRWRRQDAAGNSQRSPARRATAWPGSTSWAGSGARELLEEPLPHRGRTAQSTGHGPSRALAAREHEDHRHRNHVLVRVQGSHPARGSGAERGAAADTERGLDRVA